MLVKPDGVQRSLIGSIVSKVESKGLRIVGLKLMLISDQLARQHYGLMKVNRFSMAWWNS